MAKSNRDVLKRDLAHTFYDTVIAAQHLNKVYNVVLPQHPELADSLGTCIQGYLVIIDVLTKFAQTITGRETINWEAWRALSQAQLAFSEPIDPAFSSLYPISGPEPDHTPETQ